MQEPQPGQPPRQNAPYQQFDRPAPDPVAGPILPPRNPMFPRGRANVATVEVYEKRDMRVLWPGGRVTGGGRGLLQRPKEIYDVDLGTHRATFSTELPAGGGGALRFPADIDIQWRVADPILVVRIGVHDVATALEPTLQLLIRRVTAGVSAMSPSVAEERINKILDGEEVARIGAEWGLAIRVFARLHANDHVIEAETEVIKVVGQNKAEDLRSEQIARRAQLFTQYLQSGDIHQMAALMTANDPSSMKSVVEELLKQRAVSRRETIDFMNRLIGSGLVQKHEITEQIRVVMDWMHQSATAVITGPPRQAITPGQDYPPDGPGYGPGADNARSPDRTTLRARRRLSFLDEDEDEQNPRVERTRGRRDPADRPAERLGRPTSRDRVDDDDDYRASGPDPDVHDEYGRDRDPSDFPGSGERSPQQSAPRAQRRAKPPRADDEYDTEYTVTGEEYDNRRGRPQPGRAQRYDDEDSEAEAPRTGVAGPGHDEVRRDYRDRDLDDDYHGRDTDDSGYYDRDVDDRARRRHREPEAGRDRPRDEHLTGDERHEYSRGRSNSRFDEVPRSAATAEWDDSHGQEKYSPRAGAAEAKSPHGPTGAADAPSSPRVDFYSDDDWGGV